MQKIFVTRNQRPHFFQHEMFWRRGGNGYSDVKVNFDVTSK